MPNIFVCININLHNYEVVNNIKYQIMFKNCGVLYFKSSDVFNYILSLNDNIFDGKIIISDSNDLHKTCYIKGITHIQNLNQTYVPHEKIDCLVLDGSKQRSTDTEASIIKSKTGIPIIYYDCNKQRQKIWCAVCGTIYDNVSSKPVTKYCSEKCMKKDNGFSDKFDGVKDLNNTGMLCRLLEKDEPLLEFDKKVSDKRTVSNVKKNADKFQTSVIKDAVRLEYSCRRESYKREMKKPSFQKITSKVTAHKNSSQTGLQLGSKTASNSGDGVPGKAGPNLKLCKGVTKVNKPCTNKALANSQYCGIASHAKSNQTTASVPESGLASVPASVPASVADVQ